MQGLEDGEEGTGETVETKGEQEEEELTAQTVWSGKWDHEEEWEGLEAGWIGWYMSMGIEEEGI
eukprot:766216-Hanusia_phi.AAC.1